DSDIGDDRAAGLPAAHAQVASDTRENVVPIGEEIALSVVVAVHPVLEISRRHELQWSHGARIGAFDRQRVDLLLVGHHQKPLELGAEVTAARRVVEGKRGERVEYPIRARDAAVVGLSSKDGDDVLRRHACLGTDALQRIAMLLPESRALRDPAVGEEDLAVLPPFEHPLSRAAHLVDDLRLRTGVAENPEDRPAAESVVPGHLRSESRELCSWKPDAGL